jgi:hypothetical protein
MVYSTFDEGILEMNREHVDIDLPWLELALIIGIAFV